MKSTTILLLSVACMLCFPSLARAFDGQERLICGTNEKQEIYCTTFRGMEHGRWERLPGSLKQVIVHEGQLWGVNAHGEIYYAANVRGPQWIRMQGQATEISVGHGILCFVDDREAIFCAERGITTPNPEWHRAPTGTLKSISVN